MIFSIRPAVIIYRYLFRQKVVNNRKHAVHRSNGNHTTASHRYFIMQPVFRKLIRSFYQIWRHTYCNFQSRIWKCIFSHFFSELNLPSQCPKFLRRDLSPKLAFDLSQLSRILKIKVACSKCFFLY